MALFLFVTLLGVAMILYAATRLKEQPVLQSADRELELTLNEFMDEFEKEHQYILESIQQLQRDMKKESLANQEKFAELEAKLQELPKSRTKKSPSKQAATPAIVFNERYSRVVEMAREGRTPEQIAKDTGIGLGEIQMVLSLAKQGNAV